MFYGLAKNEAYFAEKVSLFVALAPVTKGTHTRSPLYKWFTRNYDIFYDTIEVLNLHSLFTYSWLASQNEIIFCVLFEEVC